MDILVSNNRYIVLVFYKLCFFAAILFLPYFDTFEDKTDYIVINLVTFTIYDIK